MISKLKRFVAESRKSLVPAATSLVAALTTWGITGVFDKVQVFTLLGGVVTSFLVWLIGNDSGDDVVAKAQR